MATFRQVAKSILPPVISKTIVRALGHKTWSGYFSSWKDVSEKCMAYEDQSILDKMFESTQKVISGIYDTVSRIFG